MSKEQLEQAVFITLMSKCSWGKTTEDFYEHCKDAMIAAKGTAEALMGERK